MKRPTMKENLKGYSLKEAHKLYTDCPELYRHIVTLDKYIDNLEDELNISDVSCRLPTDKEIRKFASNYSQNWKDETQKSIAYTAYHRGCKRIIRLFNSK